MTDKKKKKISTKGETTIVTEEVISDDFIIADTYNKFVNIAPSLKISPEESFVITIDETNEVKSIKINKINQS